MCKYGNILSKEELIKKMEYVELLIESLGAKRTNLSKARNERFGYRDIYEYLGKYYRVDHIAFDEKPWIVIEATDDRHSAELGAMEDTDPFSCDLSQDELKKEVEYILGLKPYPKNL